MANVQIGVFQVPLVCYNSTDIQLKSKCDEFVKLVYFGGLEDKNQYCVWVIKQSDAWTIKIDRVYKSTESYHNNRRPCGILEEDRFFYNFAFYLPQPSEKMLE